ncbi:peroxiredoxin [Kocuria sp. UBA1838]|uniref:peroxiredoxin n=1 Tax=Kocuria sp. UBA1838 TaxID=1946673 RepID=UPI00257C5056|nr:peroxiredoxin [Kocuria sp. UBA1838]
MSRELSTGDPAPALRLTAHDGSTVDLADATHSGTVVYFYPKAFTPGCTTEACDFRDNLAALKGQGYDVYGVSGDDPQELQRFVTEYHLPYTLLSDPDHAAAKEWGAWGGRTINGETSEGPLRSTFAIDPSGNLTHAQYRVDAQGHVARLVSKLSDAS